MSSLSERRPFRSPPRSSHAAERGSSLVGLLFVLIILGLMAAVTLGGLGYTSNPAITGVPLTMPGGGAIVTTTSTVPKPRNLSGADAISTCRADYATVSAAVRNYEKRNGQPPPAGTAWARTATNAGPLLRSLRQGSHYYRIRWNGSTLSVVPATGVTARGSPGTSSPPTGCFAA